MPIHFSDQDITAEVEGVRSALIVPCTMCPAATVAVREQKPFMQLFRSLFKSAPFEEYIKALRSRLADRGVQTEVFKSRLYHQWFMCMWTAGRREKLRKRAGQHDAVIVLGCESATETVREVAEASGCKVIEGMKVSGIMNAHLGFHLPGNITFDDCRIVLISAQRQEAGVAH
jgi:4-hydroxy-3-methylbut-2-enyl diphosphate reductase IspH